MKEIEAKFVTTDPTVFEQILSHQWLGGYEVRYKERQLLVTDYFDTGGWDLLKAKSVLRLRRYGRDCTVCLKTFKGRNGQIEIREEVEDALPDGIPPRLETIECPVMGLVNKVTCGNELKLVLTIENNRTVTELLRNGKPRFEMVLDDVEFVGARDQRRHFEVEIEAVDGDEYELEALLGILNSGFNMEPSIVSKFERGLRLTRIWPVGVEW